MKKIVLYGAGTQNLRLAYQPITAAGHEVIAICDKDKEKQGTFFRDIRIISPEELKKIDDTNKDYVIVITVRTHKTVIEIKEQLQELKNATIYTFEEFFSKQKLNCTIKKINQVQTHVVDHCNLNCVRCVHLSPLADNSFYLDKKEFEEDVKRLSELTKGDIEEYQLAGGEPLLHPECHIFPYIVRKWFPNTKIVIITNGTLFDKVNEDFYESCRVNKVQVWVTMYPISLDYNKVYKKLEQEEIDFVMGNPGNTEEEPKEMWGTPIKLDGNLDGQKNFEECILRNFVLRNGRIYICALATFIDLLNNYFHTDLPGSEKNGISLWEVDSLEELIERLTQKIPLCDYCDTLDRMPPIPWCVSKKEIGEWVKE